MFASAARFSESFGHLEESQQVEALQTRIRPFVLRRMKEAVEKSIPQKEETIIDIELTTLQKKYYRAIYEKNLTFLRQGVSRSNMPRLVNMEIELRKCCLTGDHRVLTSDGWKSIKEVQRGDEVLTFNMALTQAAGVGRRGDVQPATYSSNYQQEWKLVTDTTSHEADAANEADELYRMQGNTMDVIATREHRMLLAHMDWNTETGLSLQTPFGYSTVGELLPRESDDDARRAVEYEVSDPSTDPRFALSQCRSVVRGGHNRQPAAPLPPILGLERVCEWWWRLDGQISFLQYLGMWLGDGHLDVTHGLVIIAQKKEEATPWLVRLLDKLLTPDCYRINRHHSGLHQYIIDCPPLYDYLRLKAVGPLGYNPRDDGHLCNYPHFTEDEGLATEEEKSAYCTATGINSRWTEEGWLLAFLAAKDAHGPECCWWCDELEWHDGNEMLLCGGPDCMRGGHMQCAGVTAVPEGDWLCPVCLHFADIAKTALQQAMTMVMASGGEEEEDEEMNGDEEIKEEDEDRPLVVDRVDDDGDTMEIPFAEAVLHDGRGETAAQVGERLRAEGNTVWFCQPPQREEREENIDRERCAWCGRASWEEGNLLVMCSSEGCRWGGHQLAACANLPVVPQGDWFCAKCQPCRGDAGLPGMAEAAAECGPVPGALVANPVQLPPLPPLPPPVANPGHVPIPAGAGFVAWNGGWWIIINGHWFYLKRWLGTQQQVASTWSRLSRQQALAVIEGFCRADGEWKRIRYLDDEDEAQPHEPTGMWLCSHSSFPLIDQLQLLAQLAGASTEVERVAVSGRETIIEGRTVRFTVDHWRLHITFRDSRGRLPIHYAPLARPENVSTSIDARGYHGYKDDGKVYCITVEGNANFLTQRLSVKRLRSGRLGVRSAPVFVGNCQHPWLITGAEDKEVPPGVSDEEYMQKTVAASGKLVLLAKLLEKMQREGHRVLIFSQFVLVLDLLQEYCDWKGYLYERLDGGVRGNEREAAIDRFTKPDSNRFIFLLSTRAGGVGLNLATADTVIIFDSDWNPQQDMQAQARAHRIGQKRKVMIYRLVTRNTYESEMFMKASKKLGLDHAVLTNLEIGRGRGGAGGRGEGGGGEGEDGEVDKDSIDKILRLGAYGLLEDEDDSKSRAFMEGDIDEILEKHSHVISFSKTPAADSDGKVDGDSADPSDPSDEAKDPSASPAAVTSSATAGAFRLNYSKMRFSSEKDAIDINDSHFWEKLMGNSALVLPPDELLSQLTDTSAYETQANKDLFLSRLRKTVESILDAKRRGDDVPELDGLVNLLIQFCATKEFKDERLQAEEWLIEAERRVERKARMKTREDTDDVDRRRSGRRRGRRDEEQKRGSDSDFSESDGSGFEETDERTKGGRVRGRAGALMNSDLCDVCWLSGSLLGCEGQCERWFHLACLGMDEAPEEGERWLCDDCSKKSHVCRICKLRDKDDYAGEDGVRCCSVPRCGLSYHLACVRGNPLTVFYSSSSTSSFKCPSHYCYRCSSLGEVYYVHCLTCERALHVKCMGPREVRLARKIIFCEFCVDRERLTERGRAAIEGSQVHTQEQPVREKRKMKRPRKSQLASGGRHGRGIEGIKRMSKQRWETLTEEEKAEERERRAKRKEESKQRARLKQKEARARKRQERIDRRTASTMDGGTSSDGSGDSSSASASSASYSNSSHSSSGSSASSASSSASSSSSSSDGEEARPTHSFRPGVYTVRFRVDGVVEAERPKLAMFMALGKRKRRARGHREEKEDKRRRKLEKQRRHDTKRRQKKARDRAKTTARRAKRAVDDAPPPQASASGAGSDTDSDSKAKATPSRAQRKPRKDDAAVQDVVTMVTDEKKAIEDDDALPVTPLKIRVRVKRGSGAAKAAEGDSADDEKRSDAESARPSSVKAERIPSAGTRRSGRRRDTSASPSPSPPTIPEADEPEEEEASAGRVKEEKAERTGDKVRVRVRVNRDRLTAVVSRVVLELLRERKDRPLTADPKVEETEPAAGQVKPEDAMDTEMNVAPHDEQSAVQQEEKDAHSDDGMKDIVNEGKEDQPEAPALPAASAASTIIPQMDTV